MKKFTLLILTVLLTLAVFSGPVSADIEWTLYYEEYNGEITIMYYEGTGYGKMTVPGTIEGKPVTAIDEYCFADVYGVTNIILPNSIKTIGEGAFFYCSDLTSITIPNSVKTIGDSAFCACESLRTVNIGTGVKEIGEAAFEDCYKLTSVTIPDSVTKIGEYAFSGCENLTAISIPRSVTYIGEFIIEPWNNVTIYGHINSTAQRYAEMNGIPFGLLSERFYDVKSADYYFDPVEWAVKNGITAGISKTAFGPQTTCTRGQVVTFLWRAAGCPEPKTIFNPFSDIKPADYYYKPVLWAVENGITAGVSKTAFGPKQDCTRGQVVSFLWRANGAPAFTAANPFIDVSSTNYFYNAVLWAVANNITAGTDAHHFSPKISCSRGQIVTFLYRYCK